MSRVYGPDAVLAVYQVYNSNKVDAAMKQYETAKTKTEDLLDWYTFKLQSDKKKGLKKRKKVSD